MENSREYTAELLTTAGMMPVVKRFAEMFGTNGKLPGVAIITPDGAAYYGTRPVKHQRVEPLPRSEKHVR